MTDDRAIAAEDIEQAIFVLRGYRVMLDADLAALYEVDTRTLNQAVRRNRRRFPDDFMFRLTIEEARRSRSRSVILNAQPTVTVAVQSLHPNLPGRGANLKYLPYAFTEQGVAMLSSVLRSPRAIDVNVEVMRAFVRLRSLLHGNAELAAQLAELEKKNDAQFRVAFDALRRLMAPPATGGRRIGFQPDEE